MLRNGWEFCVSFFALVKLGAIAVPLNIAYKGEEAAFQLNDSGSIMLIVNPEFRDVITEIRPEIGEVRNIFATDTGEFLELLERSFSCSRVSASYRMVRNFQMLNSRPPCPARL